jgi:hypothetical protein
MNHIPPEERNVFRYFDGERVAYADPMRVNRRLVAELDGDVQLWLSAYNSADARARSDAVERLAPATLAAFDLPGFDTSTGDGVTEEVAMNLLRTFLEWMAAKKKTPGNSPTYSPPSEGLFSAGESFLTPTSSVSGSTSDGCGCN